MNKKEYKIWQETKYNEYLLNGHIFSYEKQLKFQGKIVLDYIVFDSYEAQTTFKKLNIKNNTIENKKVIIENFITYDNKKHSIWEVDDNLLYIYAIDSDEDFEELELLKEGKPLVKYKNFTEVKIWN